MKMIVGLGNPGKKYEKTRHNIGYMILEEIMKISKVKKLKSKFNGKYFEEIINNEKVIFLFPQSYMNLSGEDIYKYIQYFDINIEDVFIIHDDLDLSLGKYRLKVDSGTGGHNGLKDIEKHLKTKEYKRLKIGIGRNAEETRDYVLGNFSKEEKVILEKIIDRAVTISFEFLEIDFSALMNKYN